MKTVKLFSLLLLTVLMAVSCNRSNLGPNPITGTPVGVNVLVRVINATTSQPIPGARVTLKKDSQNVAPDQVSDGSGIATFPNIPSGEGYKAFAGNIPGYTPGASPSIVLEGDTEVAIQMIPSLNGAVGLIAGSVKMNQTQAPMAGVNVSLVAAGGVFPAAYPGGVAAQGVRRPQPYYPPYRIQQFAPPVANAIQTDAAGQFTFNSIPPGSYRVVFQLPGFREAVRDNVVVSEGQSTTVETVFMTSERTPGAAGHILIAETGRAQQIDTQGKIAWRFESRGLSAATRLPSGETLIADEQLNQVSTISADGRVIWSLGSTLGLLSTVKAPGWVAAARDGQSFLVADSGNNRVIEIAGGQIVWQFQTGLSRPRAATYTPQGNIIIADTGNRRVLEVTRDGQVAWSFFKDMNAPVHALRMEDGNTVITDAGFNRVIIVNQAAQPVWYFDGSLGGGAPPDPASALNRPRSTYADATGNFLIADTGNNRILEVSRQRQVVNTIPASQPQWIERL
jgi:hypothetical protein